MGVNLITQRNYFSKWRIPSTTYLPCFALFSRGIHKQLLNLDPNSSPRVAQANHPYLCDSVFKEHQRYTEHIQFSPAALSHRI